MKINLHSHSNYSDGDDLREMAEAHKKEGFSAYVVTDHVYPMFLAKDKKSRYSMCMTSYEKFYKQTIELDAISKQLDFPCFQGIELALTGEEVLVFGEKAIHDVFDYLSKINLEEQEKYGETAQYKRKLTKYLIDILKKNKKDSAVILCHPHLIYTNKDILKDLYELVDGYEFQNGNTYYFSEGTDTSKKQWLREIPIELKNKKKFYNSDAHSVKNVTKSKGNFHSSKITTMEELISYIKTPQNNNLLVFSRKNSNGKR